MTPVALGILLAIAGILIWTWLVRTVILPPVVQALGAYLVVWIPLGACAWAGRRRAALRVASNPRESAGAGIPSFAFRPIDLLWGAGIGLLLRGVATSIEFVATGRMPAGGAAVLIDPTTAWLVLVVAPILVAPFVEEWFFRGTTLPVVRDATASAGASRVSPRVATATGVVVSALLFGLLHAVEAPSPTSAVVTAASALCLGIAVGALVAFTNRLGGAIIAHAVFNGTLIALLV